MLNTLEREGADFLCLVRPGCHMENKLLSTRGEAGGRNTNNVGGRQPIFYHQNEHMINELQHYIFLHYKNCSLLTELW